MSWHLRHAGVLASSLLLLLNLLIVQSLLLLFGHVGSRAIHASLCLGHGGNIVRRSDIVGGIDTVLGT